jgi:hypothetical protein
MSLPSPLSIFLEKKKITKNDLGVKRGAFGADDLRIAHLTATGVVLTLVLMDIYITLVI